MQANKSILHNQELDEIMQHLNHQQVKKMNEQLKKHYN